MGAIDKALHQTRGNAEEAPVIVVFMDFDRFKVINESLGHQAGGPGAGDAGPAVAGNIWGPMPR